MVFAYRRFKPRKIRKPPKKGTARVQTQRLIWVFQAKGNMSRVRPVRGERKPKGNPVNWVE